MEQQAGPRPTFIPIPPSPFHPLAYSNSPSSIPQDDPFQSSPLISPNLTFYTAPSTPLPETPSDGHPPRTPSSPPPLPVLHINIPHHSPNQFSFGYPSPNAFPPSSVPSDPSPVSSPVNIVQEPYPDTPELPVDMFFDDESLSTLERIYLYSRSKSSYHRVFIANVLPAWLEQVTPQEAVEYVLPLLNTLAMDDDEMVKEAFASKLITIMWWFLTHCQLIPEQTLNQDDTNPPQFHDQEHPPSISVQAFTAILGTLLLSPSTIVEGAARYTVVEILDRIRRLGSTQSAGVSQTSQSDPADELDVGLFGKEERSLFEQEILYQVVIGMGRLDAENEPEESSDDDDSQSYDDALEDQQRVDDSVSSKKASESIRRDPPSSQSGAQGGTVTTAQDLPQSGRLDANVTSYFPIFPPSSTGSSSSTPQSTTETTPSDFSDDSFFSSRSSTSSSLSSQADSNETVSLSVDSQSLSLSPPGSQVHLRVEPQKDDSAPTASLLNPETSPNNLGATSEDLQAHDEALALENQSADHGGADQAAIGRLSSMSLMAAVAASGGCSDDTTQRAFVSEVERASHDPIYWVRREACFALGALAKVVPDELFLVSLMPLFESLIKDSVVHVRHSSLYAFPAILSRLPPARRRQLALDVLVPMSMDESPEVRSGVLEALGEVIYTLHSPSHQSPRHHQSHMSGGSAVAEDDISPPQQLLRMFLGRAEDRRILDGQQARGDSHDSGWSDVEMEWIKKKSGNEEALRAFYEDPMRPLICAFNFPAVALTLGPSRWASDLREMYQILAKCQTLGVQRTLAASLGELAKIVGPEIAFKDLFGVWKKAVRSEESEVRIKAIEAFEAYCEALDKKGQREMLMDLLAVWEGGFLKGWREREKVAGCLVSVINAAMGPEIRVLIARLEVLSLQDCANAVREAGVGSLWPMWFAFDRSNEEFIALKNELHILARSEKSRHRMTYIACLQALPMTASSSETVLTMFDDILPSITPLARDPILGVRIGLARFLLSIFSRSTEELIPNSVTAAIDAMKDDSSKEVVAFINAIHSHKAKGQNVITSSNRASPKVPPIPPHSIFSRPPPAFRQTS